MARIWQTFAERRQRSPETVTRERITDYRVVFGGDAGQRVLADICQRAGVMQTSYGTDGPEATAFREGRRRLALEIIETINSDPAASLRMATTGNTEEIFDSASLT